MTQPRVTIVISPRERFSLSERALASIYENTPTPFNLIYVTGGAPDQVYPGLVAESEARGFKLIHSPRYLSPSEARNLAIPLVNTQFVVFLDNDALVAPNWLENLVRCADETNATIVGPLYMIGEFSRGTIHMAGGMLRETQVDGRRLLEDEQFHYDTSISRVTSRLHRRQCDYVEFHCMLVRRDFFDETGLLDEALLNLHEERDICLLAIRAGGSVYMEPTAVVTYVAPPPCEWWDLPYFMLRWSEEWSVASVRHFNRKWDVDAVQHISDSTRRFDDGTVVGFASAWRSRVAGLQIPCDEVKMTPLEQAQVMVALLASVHREYFHIDVRDLEGTLQMTEEAASTPTLIMGLACLDSSQFNYQAAIAPIRREVGNEPALISVEFTSQAEVASWKHLAFMSLAHPEGRFTLWFAVSPRRWAEARADLESTEQAEPTPVALAGSMAPGLREHIDPRVRLVGGQVGRLLSDHEMKDRKLLNLLSKGEVR